MALKQYHKRLAYAADEANTVEAGQWEPWFYRNPDFAAVKLSKSKDGKLYYYVETIVGNMRILPGDWLVKSTTGYRPVTNKNFQVLFEEVQALETVDEESN